MIQTACPLIFFIKANDTNCVTAYLLLIFLGHRTEHILGQNSLWILLKKIIKLTPLTWTQIKSTKHNTTLIKCKLCSLDLFPFQIKNSVFCSCAYPFQCLGWISTMHSILFDQFATNI